ncbi:hypothetical protein [Clostridium sp.]|uniref:hypothetical protein n=1 Tax=Clostridium sp. TaxID=1506 RepID=UPI003F40EAB9
MVNGETIFFDTNYNHYLIQYIEKLGNDYSDNQKIHFTVIDDKNAIMSVPKSINGLIIRKNMPFITYINRP